MTFDKLYNPKMKEEDGRMPHATWDCNLDTVNLPMAHTVCSPICNTWEEVREFVAKHLDTHQFVKTCQFSPKDWGKPVFKTVDAAMEALQQSTRTRLGRHIVMKAARTYTSESRCFYAADKLRAVCGDMDHQLVTEFFEKYKWDIPFHYCCIELGHSESSGVELIEINTFTELCDPAPLQWSQDWHTLFFAEEVEWRDVDISHPDRAT